MRRTAYLGLCLMVFTALAAPLFAQKIDDPTEYAAYMKVYEEKDPAKKAAAGEKFLTDYPKSAAVTHTYMQILLSYHNAKNFAKALETADKQQQMAPGLSADEKKTVNLVGQAAAEQVKNTAKLQSYAEKVIADDPKNTGALITLSNLLANSVPTANGPAKDAHLTKTLDITRRALAAPKIAGVADAQWNPIVAQLHDTECMVLLNQKKNADAITACQEAIKTVKKDGYAYYLMGLAMKPAVADSIANYKAAVDKLNLDENRKADQVVRDELTANKDALDKVMTTKTDELIKMFATSMATGWQGAANPSAAELKAFNKPQAELDQMIQQIKSENGW